MAFNNKVVLITGASSGIGAATAIQFSKKSAILVLTGRNPANLNKTAEECFKNSNLYPLQIVADLSKDEDVKRVISETEAKFGKIDVLVNSAAILHVDDIEKTTIESFDKVVNTNLRSLVNLTLNALPLLVKSKGNIINISSVGTVKVIPGFMHDSMVKAAVDCFTKHLGVEMAPKQVRANGIILGLVSDTNIFRDVKNNAEFEENYLKLTPMGNALLPEEVANLILYMASDEARGMTGSNVVFDGGYTLAN